jgi:uncharacterized protein (DUF2236 family)
MSPTAKARLPEPAPFVAAEITRRVNAERLALLGWGRAILLQLAHPLIAAGVYEHSAFRQSARVSATRLHATIRAMLGLTFGNDADRAAVLEVIRTIHRRVNGSLSTAVGPFPIGASYSAEDPALVEWVHVTLLESVPLVFDLFVAPLSEADRDEYCDQAAWVATALGARPSEVPRSWAAVRARLERGYASGVITVGPQARELSRSIVAPAIGRLLPPAAWLNRLVTVGLLPPHVRHQYGFTWNERRQRTLERVIPAIGALRRTLPDRVALWPEARQR